ncbi:cysteine-rich secretory protein 3-like isoform X2 [Lissotriton helveticus]
MIVEKHNELRRAVKPCPGNMLRMEWSAEAAKNAELWAKNCNFCHSEEDKRTIPAWSCGENLFMASYCANWTEAIQEWFDEEQNYTYGIGPAHEHAMIGHFTQVVWARSFQIGCAVARCKTFYLYVCDYCPAGNEADQIKKPYESAKPCEKCPKHCDKGLCTNPCPYLDKIGNCKKFKRLCKRKQAFRDQCEETCLCQPL